MNGPKKRTPLYCWFKSNLDKIYEITSSKWWHFNISHVTISKNVDCSTSSLTFTKFDLLANKDLKKATPYNQRFKSNLDKSYKVTSSKSYHFDISHETISKMDCSASSLIYRLNSTFQLINSPKRKNSFFISMIQIKFWQKLWNHFFEILTFKY